MARAAAKRGIDPAEVSWFEVATMKGGRSKARQPRSLDRRSLTITGRHLPTGIAVQGAIPEGHYTRNQMRTLQEAEKQRLLHALEAKLAHAGRQPGR
jgi:hypothetical protein